MIRMKLSWGESETRSKVPRDLKRLAQKLGRGVGLISGPNVRGQAWIGIGFENWASSSKGLGQDQSKMAGVGLGLGPKHQGLGSGQGQARDKFGIESWAIKNQNDLGSKEPKIKTKTLRVN